MITINVTKISDHQFTVEFPYDAYLVRRIKTLKGVSWDAEKKLWIVDIDGGKTLVNGDWQMINQLGMVRRGHLNPNFEANINFTKLTA